MSDNRYYVKILLLVFDPGELRIKPGLRWVEEGATARSG
jgi:hypothetical protein